MDPVNPQLSHHSRSVLISNCREPLQGGLTWVDSWSKLVTQQVVPVVEMVQEVLQGSIMLADIVVKCNMGKVVAQAFHQVCQVIKGEENLEPMAWGEESPQQPQQDDTGNVSDGDNILLSWLGHTMGSSGHAGSV